MPEIVNCPQCERKLKVPDTLLGKSVKCPTCGVTFTAEAAGGTAPPSYPPEPERQIRSREEPPPSRQREEPPPSRRSRRQDEDDYEDDYDDRPRKRSRRSRGGGGGGYLQPHRGGLILTLGILSFFFAPLILGPIAWIMGNND